MTTNIFDLEKIKELTSSIEDLHIELHKMNDLKNEVVEYANNITELAKNNEIINFYEKLIEIMERFYNKLIKVSRENINIYFFYQDNLIKKYKEIFKEKLKKGTINEKFTKKIGINLIENKELCKIILNTSFTPSIELYQWLDIIDSLNQSSIFINTIRKVSDYYNILNQEKLNKIFSELPQDTDGKLIEAYKKAFFKNPNLTFLEFIQKGEKEFTQEELKIKKKIIQEAKEKEEIENLKKNQQEQQEVYQNYLSLSDSEFKRLRRRKKREKLKDVIIQPINETKIDLPKDITQKIEEFKSHLENSFETEYFIKKDENKDPLDLIRERKKKKKEEYKQFEEHFEDK